MDGFELLRRAKDLAVGLGDACNVHNVKLDGLFCRFDETTGWPVYSMKEDGGPASARSMRPRRAASRCASS
jgi:hypothetical protein